MVTYIVVRDGEIANILSNRENHIIRIIDFDNADIDKREELSNEYDGLLKDKKIFKGSIEEV